MGTGTQIQRTMPVENAHDRRPPDIDQMADKVSASEKPRAYLDHDEIG
jgi:hypothetical protein